VVAHGVRRRSDASVWLVCDGIRLYSCVAMPHISDPQHGGSTGPLTEMKMLESRSTSSDSLFLYEDISQDLPSRY
jgi:hypothetical protein